MVAARYADEGDDAIPADRMVLDPVSLMTIDDIKVTSGNYSIPTGQLYLRPGHRYRITVSDGEGKIIGGTTIEVGNPSAAASVGNAPGPDAPPTPCAAAGDTIDTPCRNATTHP
jgi:hypothetical protein